MIEALPCDGILLRYDYVYTWSHWNIGDLHVPHSVRYFIRFSHAGQFFFQIALGQFSVTFIRQYFRP